MSCLRRFVLSCILLSLAAPAAQAADFPSLPPAEPLLPSLPVQEFSSGWYLRGDLGYRFQRARRANAPFGADPTSNRLSNVFTAGGGGGFKMNWLRADVTADYGTRARYRGRTIFASPDYTAWMDGALVLANGYLDLGTWWGATPYVGAGAGISYLRLSDFDSVSAPPGRRVGGGNLNFAWAAMAGIGYRVSPNLMIDIGYRYAVLGDARTRPYGPTNDRFFIRDVKAHEVRVGMRYLID
jgi:opacity protein-like surface antigen